VSRTHGNLNILCIRKKPELLSSENVCGWTGKFRRKLKAKKLQEKESWESENLALIPAYTQANYGIS
jgi:hypothetical protein